MHHTPFVIGISGGSGSGKTSLTRTLVETLGPDGLAHLRERADHRALARRHRSALGDQQL